MGWLEKNFVIHERNEDGKLLPIDYPVPELGGKMITIIPMTRGELQNLVTKRRESFESLSKEQEEKGSKTIEEAEKKAKNRDGTWEDLVLQHIVKPVFTKEELKDAKMIQCEGKYKDLVVIFLDAIYSVSGIPSLEKAEEDLKKK